MSVTALGAADGDVGGAAGRVVEYLDGRRPARGGRNPGQAPAPTSPDGTSRVVGYYADSVEGPGTWLGKGVGDLQLEGEVDPAALRMVLMGRHPETGAPLTARPDAGGNHADRVGSKVASTGPPDELLAAKDAAEVLGITVQHVRRLARAYERAEAKRAVETAAGVAPRSLPASHLKAVRTGSGAWLVSRGEIERFKASQRRPPAVVGYDVTFSAPKSVSVLWARASPAEQEQVLGAIDAAVGAGVDYLEARAARIRVSGETVPAPGILAASYLHATSRALDPQLHRHVVIANIGATTDGQTRALDGRPLFAHAKTAGYLAAAELRHQLTQRLGVRWGEVHNGLADIVGIERPVVQAMSTRTIEINELLSETGLGSAAARQVAAYDTRVAKAEPVDPEALRPWWHERLAEVGFDEVQLRACLGVVAGPTPVDERTVEEWFSRLASARGVTERAATFDRRDVIQALASLSSDRLSASDVERAADSWLATPAAVSLATTAGAYRRDVMVRADGRAVPAVTGEPVFTTPSMLAAESRVLTRYEAGRNVASAVVPTSEVDAALASRPTIGDDQAAMVRAVTGSGHRVQCVLGPAGSGKTFALETAARAWEASGYQPVGVAVGGTAAEVLARATGIPSSTLASLLTRLDTADDQPIGPHTVLIVDEASTVGTRELDRLLAHAERAGAAVRLVGDPAQHASVDAGGAFRYLVERYPDDTAELTTLRRQAGDEMSEVRRALTAYRGGAIAAALESLDAESRIVEAATPEALLETLVADWYADRQARLPGQRQSSMVAEHHLERRELNRRARSLLLADGSVSGPGLTVDGVTFQVGDEVITRTQDRSLRPAGGGRRSFVRNGTRGVVTAVGPGAAELTVDFEGRGPITVPETFLRREIRPGVTGGLVHGYAVTSHAAQGETYEAARHLATDRSTRAGVYVGLSRGTSDVRLYTVRRRDLFPEPSDDPALPRLIDTSGTRDAVAGRLVAGGTERLASEYEVLEPAPATPPSELEAGLGPELG